jgi:hypothetical protein
MVKPQQTHGHWLVRDKQSTGNGTGLDGSVRLNAATVTPRVSGCRAAFRRLGPNPLLSVPWPGPPYQAPPRSLPYQDSMIRCAIETGGGSLISPLAMLARNSSRLNQ